MLRPSKRQMSIKEAIVPSCSKNRSETAALGREFWMNSANPEDLAETGKLWPSYPLTLIRALSGQSLVSHKASTAGVGELERHVLTCSRRLERELTLRKWMYWVEV